MGTIEDLENMNLDQKLTYLRSNASMKCSYKNELLQEHDYSWRTNGLSSLQYTIVKRYRYADSVMKVEVDVELNREDTDMQSPMNFLADYQKK